MRNPSSYPFFYIIDRAINLLPQLRAFPRIHLSRRRQATLSCQDNYPLKKKGVIDCPGDLSPWGCPSPAATPGTVLLPRRGC